MDIVVSSLHKCYSRAENHMMEQSIQGPAPMEGEQKMGLGTD